MARPNGQIIIDADSHVEEADDVWNHLDPAYAHRRPVIVQHPGLPGPYAQDAYWLIDGQMFPRPYGYGPLIYGMCRRLADDPDEGWVAFLPEPVT